MADRALSLTQAMADMDARARQDSASFGQRARDVVERLRNPPPYVPLFDDTGYDRGFAFPARRNIETGEMEFAWPGFIADPLNAMGRAGAAARVGQQVRPEDVMQALGLVGAGGLAVGKAPAGSVGAFLGRTTPPAKSMRELDAEIAKALKRIEPSVSKEMRKILDSSNYYDAAVARAYSRLLANSQDDAMMRIADEYAGIGSTPGSINFYRSAAGHQQPWPGEMLGRDRQRFLDMPLASRHEELVKNIADLRQASWARGHLRRDFDLTKAMREIGNLQEARAAQQYFSMIRQGQMRELPDVVRSAQVADFLRLREQANPADEYARLARTLFLPNAP